jgi:hypothetical protein
MSIESSAQINTNTLPLTRELLQAQTVTTIYYRLARTWGLDQKDYILFASKPEGFTKEDIDELPPIIDKKHKYKIQLGFDTIYYAYSSNDYKKESPEYTIYGEYESPIADSIAVAKSTAANKEYGVLKSIKKGISKRFRQAFFHTDNLRIYYKLNSSTGEISIDQISLLDNIDQDTTIGFQFIPLFENGKYTAHMTKPLRKKLDKMLKDIKKDGNELIHLAPGGKLYEELKEKWDRMKATGSTTDSQVYDIEVKGGQNRKTKRKRKSRRK